MINTCDPPKKSLIQAAFVFSIPQRNLWCSTPARKVPFGVTIFLPTRSINVPCHGWQSLVLSSCEESTVSQAPENALFEFSSRIHILQKPRYVKRVESLFSNLLESSTLLIDGNNVCGRSKNAKFNRTRPWLAKVTRDRILNDPSLNSLDRVLLVFDAQPSEEEIQSPFQHWHILSQKQHEIHATNNLNDVSRYEDAFCDLTQLDRDCSSSAIRFQIEFSGSETADDVIIRRATEFRSTNIDTPIALVSSDRDVMRRAREIKGDKILLIQSMYFHWILNPSGVHDV